MTKIYWDKGHGGTDPGAVGNGLQEKTLTHKIVEYAMAYINANYTGVLQRTSRTGDETKSLAQRTSDANAWGADLLVSVHINSATAAANGFESFVYTNASAASIALQNVLHAEIMAVMKAWGISTDRGKKRANFHMVRESKMPAALTENLFISNTYDANRLKDEAFLKAVGEAHARGVAKFKGLQPKIAQPAPVQKKEEIEMLEKAIVINSFADFPVCEPLAARLKAPIYTRAALPAGKVAKEVFIVGGEATGIQADKHTVLAGNDRYETAAAVKKYLG